ncbi:hypothetical protein P5V43_05290 [Mycobacteroides abscessus subsp. bolletii]|uniref:hypothetical protein n=1 Tax=Mycobacteroides abscessus TaxID=36809 RepID=UPI000926FB52|nr:hypothetical protein [Mycobacteroides abscessus]MDO3126515.1 hypothetical protein [Mycobacteroides abscessus subsp. bolletii]SHR59830.1 Uncharacterised protein [Mycobacteroides abscessus subsp. abscessus]
MGKDDSVYFLLAYSLDEGKLVRQDEFTVRDEAVAAYEEAENHYRPNLDRYEVVLIGADSIETVMLTHGHYFRQSEDSIFSEFLTGSI